MAQVVVVGSVERRPFLWGSAISVADGRWCLDERAVLDVVVELFLTVGAVRLRWRLGGLAEGTEREKLLRGTVGAA